MPHDDRNWGGLNPGLARSAVDNLVSRVDDGEWFPVSGADVLANLPVGLLTELAVDGRFVYGNGPGHRTAVIGEVRDGSWISAGEHDVTGWVSGVVSVGPWVVRAEPGRIQVATRQ